MKLQFFSILSALVFACSVQADTPAGPKDFRPEIHFICLFTLEDGRDLADHYQIIKGTQEQLKTAQESNRGPSLSKFLKDMEAEGCVEMWVTEDSKPIKGTTYLFDKEDGKIIVRMKNQALPLEKFLDTLRIKDEKAAPSDGEPAK